MATPVAAVVAVYLTHVVLPSGLLTVHPAGGKVVPSKPSINGRVAAVGKLTVTDAASFAVLPSATPFGREVLIEILLLPETRLMAGRVTLMVELEERDPTQEKG